MYIDMVQSVKLTNGTVIAYYQLPPCSTGGDYSTQLPSSFHTPTDYDHYLLACVPQIYTQSLFFYQFPEQFVLYSSLKQIPKEYMSLQLNMHGLSPAIAYSIRRPLRLVALDHKSNVDVLLATALQQGHPELVHAFKTGDFSTILPFFCSLGFDGCVGRFSETLPYTVTICQPSHWLTKSKSK
uniref:Uncharacterized protein n=1 Tax=viral metagenome TaxID=1070528 RepID=A0A6C0BLI7_9ZZZZ